MASIKELLQFLRGKPDSSLEKEWHEVIQPAIDEVQRANDLAIRQNNEYRRKFGHRDSQPNGHEKHHIVPAEHSLTDPNAPMRRP